jgi:hypothetical protein
VTEKCQTKKVKSAKSTVKSSKLHSLKRIGKVAGVGAVSEKDVFSAYFWFHFAKNTEIGV